VVFGFRLSVFLSPEVFCGHKCLGSAALDLISGMQLVDSLYL
jgi:hypothetical protein